jgi:hypothetical protein
MSQLSQLQNYQSKVNVRHVVGSRARLGTLDFCGGNFLANLGVAGVLAGVGI